MGGHVEREHTAFSPSQSERFLNCPGSYNLLKRVPARATSIYAEMGTKAHEVLDAALQNRCRRAVEAHREYSTQFAEEFDDEFLYSVQSCLDYVYEILDEYPDAILYCERRVDPPLPTAPGEGAGYCDICIYIPSIRTVYIIDYKHGGGVAKDAKENKQALQYAGGFLYEDNAVIDPSTVDEVVIVIVQPRAFHEDGPIREWPVSPFDVYAHLDVLDEGVALCLKPDAPLIPGDWCTNTFCDARTVCPAREAFGFSKINEQFANVYDLRAPSFPATHGLDVQRLAYLKQWGPYVKKLFDDVDQHVQELLEQGYDVPGFKLVETQAKRRWFGQEWEVAGKLATLLEVPIDKVYVPKLINITDAEPKLVEHYKSKVGRGKKKQAAEEAKLAMALLTLKQSSGNLTVVSVDDPRPSANKADAFAGISGLLAPPS